MKLENPFRDLTRFEWGLWLTSVIVILIAFLFSGGGDRLAILTSFVGVTSLIFVAKGYIFGQVLTLGFAILYGVISLFYRYYGEAITYLCMAFPMGIAVLVSWIRHPNKGTKEVCTGVVPKAVWIGMSILAMITTVIFYFILRALGNANLEVSTISITTSFFAAYLSYYRSPYYALAYAVNDIILIVLWSMATMEQISYLPMIFCFVMFLANDIYAFYNWNRMQKRQQMMKESDALAN